MKITFLRFLKCSSPVTISAFFAFAVAYTMESASPQPLIFFFISPSILADSTAIFSSKGARALFSLMKVRCFSASSALSAFVVFA